MVASLSSVYFDHYFFEETVGLCVCMRVCVPPLLSLAPSADCYSCFRGSLNPSSKSSVSTVVHSSEKTNEEAVRKEYEKEEKPGIH